MGHFQYHLTLFLSLLAFYSSVSANNEEASILGDIETVSIATGMERQIVTAPAVASVFSAKYIKNSGARNLTDILNMVPGIHVGISPINFSPIYSVRGFSSSVNKNILIMIDSIPQDELVFGSKLSTLGKIPIDMIDRVEISRGPGSALWGADALSAVVNIITKTKAPESSLIALSGGSHDTQNARLLSGTDSLGDFDLVASFEHSTSEGHGPIIVRDKQTLLDESFGTNASHAPGNAATDSEETGLFLNLSNNNSQIGFRVFNIHYGMGIGMTAALDPSGFINNEGLEASYRYGNKINRDLELGATLSYTYTNNLAHNLHFFPPGAFGIFPDGVILNEENRQSFSRLNTAFRYSGLDKHYMTLGLGGEHVEIKELEESRNYSISDRVIVPMEMRDTLSDPVLGISDYSRTLKFVYLQDEWTLHPDVNFTLGVRCDDYSDYGSVASQRAVLQWNTTYALTTKLLYGRGFRTLSVHSTQSRHFAAYESNPKLKPEKFDQIQIAFDYRPLPYLRTRIDLFHHKTIDRVRLKRIDLVSIRPENSGKQTGHGLEMELWWDISDRTNFYSFYAYQKNSEKASNSDSGYSPHHKLFGMLQHERADGWLFNTKLTYIGSRDRIPSDQRQAADRYTFIDILTRKKINHHLEATLEIRNILDEKADEAGYGEAFPGDIPLPGRSYYITISSTF